MRRLVLTSTLALTFAASAAFCQQPTQRPANDATATRQQPGNEHGHRAFDAHKTAQRLGKRLNLTEDQTAKLEPILATQQQKMAALRSDTSLSRDQRRQQLQAIRQDTKGQLATVLTPTNCSNCNPCVGMDAAGTMRLRLTLQTLRPQASVGHAHSMRSRSSRWRLPLLFDTRLYRSHTCTPLLRLDLCH